jgi:hypothetical protein
MTNIALLAPVPFVHLADGEQVSKEKGKVAFGSRAWEVFRDLDTRRGNEPVPVLIYASMTVHDGPPAVTWNARYIGHVNAKNGAHPDGMKYRPPSTGEHPSDNAGHWAVFWEVDQLHPLPDLRVILIKNLQGLSGKYYKPGFVPEGPIIVQNPWHV